MDKKFTGQRLDGTGLYYYNARYYDPIIGRFISPDGTGQNLNEPQTLNRYSYVQNNPLKYTDPTGHFALRSFLRTALIVAVVVVVVAVVVAAAIIAAPIVATAVASAATMIGATTVASGALAAAAAATPIAAAVAGTPVLGAAATIVAGVGLDFIGIGSASLNSVPTPDTLNHFTNVEPGIINAGGIDSPSGINYATNLGNLSPILAQSALALNSPASNVYSIDVNQALEESSAILSGPSWIIGRNGLPTGAWEWTFDRPIPPTALK
jgi:RHS repeat-associated protein